MTCSGFLQLEMVHDLDEPSETVEHVWSTGLALAHVMDHADGVAQGMHTKVKTGGSHAQQHTLQKGLNSFGKHGHEALEKETGQLDN